MPQPWQRQVMCLRILRMLRRSLSMPFRKRQELQDPKAEGDAECLMFSLLVRGNLDRPALVKALRQRSSKTLAGPECFEKGQGTLPEGGVQALELVI